MTVNAKSWNEFLNILYHGKYHVNGSPIIARERVIWPRRR